MNERADSSNSPPVTALQPGDALLLVDVQNDLLPGGPLGVPRGEEIIPVLNNYISRFQRHLFPIFATRDWHPPEHASFQSQSGPWPAHCLAFSHGADFAAGLKIPSTTIVISKGLGSSEGYSAFDGTDLDARLRAVHVQRLFIGGLPSDFGVQHTVQDALLRGFHVFLLRDAVRPLSAPPNEDAQAEQELIRLGAVPITFEQIRHSNPASSALLTDIDKLSMLQACFAGNMNEVAVFEFTVRSLPPRRNFLVAAGLEQVLDFLEHLQFTPSDLEWLASTQKFPSEFLRQVQDFRFTGEVHAMPEGTVFFPHEPVLRITAPLGQAQLVESRITQLLQYQILVASKAARMVLASRRKKLIEVGLRRAHGAEAGLYAARACYLAGFFGTSDAWAAQQLDIPLIGTLPHSFLEASVSEADAFRLFARTNSQNIILPIDVFDSETATEKIVELASSLSKYGLKIFGVELGDENLAQRARMVRGLLDEGNLQGVSIFARGTLDEYSLESLRREGAPLDGFGIGTCVVTSDDAPYLDCAYTLQSYDGHLRHHDATDVVTWPGVKAVYRNYDENGLMEWDAVSLADENPVGEPLLQGVMAEGKRVHDPESLQASRERAARHLHALPLRLRKLEPTAPLSVVLSKKLRGLCVEVGTISDAGDWGNAENSRDVAAPTQP
jgi:nicotinate phosphoribosyltransferase